jgi:hypothetical protein
MSAYTPSEEAILETEYSKNPCLETVDRLCVLVNKPRKSIIAKLVKMGLYIARGYRTKKGETPIPKLALVRTIEEAIDGSLPGLDKTPKQTLQLLSDSVTELAYTLETALGELSSIKELEKVRSEMKICQCKKKTD